MDLLGWMRMRTRPSASAARPDPTEDELDSAPLLRVARLAVNPMVPVADLLRAVTEEMAQVLGGPVDIYAWTPDRKGLALRASCGWSTAGLAMARLEGSESLVVQLADGSLQSFGLIGGVTVPTRAIEQGITGGVSAPIEAHGVSWGVLIAWTPAREEGPGDRRLRSERRVIGDVAKLLGDTVSARLGGVLPAANSGDGVLVVDSDHRLRTLCPTAEVLLGLSGLSCLGKRIDKIPALAPLLPALISQRSEGPVQVGSRSLELSFRKMLGPRGGASVQVLVRDVTRLRRAEAEVEELQAALAQARRLEAIGAVAAGLAHDFNNLLTVILTTGGLVLRDERLTDSGRGDVEQMVQAAQRGSALVRQLLAFAPEPQEERSTVRPASVVARLEPMLSLMLSDRVQLVLDVQSSGAVRADLGQIEQVVMNLILNARDALPQGGTIRVGVHGVEQEGQHWVRFTVADDGVGMSPSVSERIFEPFFTTKGTNGGTGLGLPTVRRIVRACGGRIDVDSAPGHGSCFSILLPEHRERPEPTALPTPPQMLRPPGEGVLLVEADEEARAQLRRLLAALGFGVIEACSAEEALRAWRHEVIPVDLLLIGRVGDSPEEGVNLLYSLREVRPLLPAILIAEGRGSAPDLAILPRDVCVLTRPLEMNELAEVLQEVLDTDGTLDESVIPLSAQGKPAIR